MQDDSLSIDIAIGRDENSKIVIEASNEHNEIILKLPHNVAAIVAETILLNVAEVELEIDKAVERMTQLG